jgi:DNA-binding GntR family transcriptional regulator
MVDEHDDIIAAVAAGDAERADRIAGNHATQVVRQIQNFLAQGGIARDIALSPPSAPTDNGGDHEPRP